MPGKIQKYFVEAARRGVLPSNVPAFWDLMKRFCPYLYKKRKERWALPNITILRNFYHILAENHEHASWRRFHRTLIPQPGKPAKRPRR